MKTSADQSLWRWICIRISIFSICSVFVFVASIWLRYALQALWLKQQMPIAVREEFARIKAHPPADPARFHQIIDQWWGLSFSDPNIATEDWLTIGVLLVILIPCLVLWGLKTVRPLAVQFSRLTGAARAVAGGDFSAEARPLSNVPTEMTSFVHDFNHMTQQLARYDRELRASHVAMAHELRSPLTAAMGRLQGMMDGVFPADNHQLARVMKQLQSLNQLADGLQLLSLADADRLQLDCHRFNLTELLKERIAWVHNRAEQAGLVITLEADSHCLLQADAGKIGQLITLLLENTLAYASEGIILTICVTPQAANLEMTFRDAGPGVSADFLATMFERFTRAETSRARHSGGCGLGLSIARAICHAHHGEITATLPASGGLAVRVTLPRVSPALTES